MGTLNDLNIFAVSSMCAKLQLRFINTDVKSVWRAGPPHVMCDLYCILYGANAFYGKTASDDDEGR